MLEGGCLCEGARYEIHTNIKWATHCHCAMCRRQHGAAFATYATIGRKHLIVKDPDGTLTRFSSSPHVSRTFCGRCGSSLFWEDARYPKLIEVTLGTLDGDPGHAPDAHIFTASRAPWWFIEDELPRYDEHAPEELDAAAR
jgi:hypothetical protein